MPPPPPPPPLPDGGTTPGEPLEAPFTLPALQTEVPTYELTLSPSALEAFRRDPYLPEVRGTFIVAGVKKPALIRVRGGSSRHYVKKSWRVECVGVPCVDGRAKLNLVAEQADRTMMVEKLAFDLLAALHAPAPRTTYVRLKINGRYEGVYLEIERVDKAFTAAREFLDEDPNIYRCGSQDCEMKLWRAPYQGRWEKETNESQPSSDLTDFLEAVNHTPEPEFPEAMTRLLDVRDYLSSMVMDALIANDIVMDSGSYLIHDRARKQWVYVPWDLNNSAARWWPTYGLGVSPYSKRPTLVFTLFDSRVEFFYDQRKPLTSGDYFPAFSNLSTRFAMNPVLRARYLERLSLALDSLFDPALLGERIDDMYFLIDDHVAADPYVGYLHDGAPDPDGLAKFQAGRAFLKRFVRERREFLRAEVRRLTSPPLGLALAAFDPAGGWIELENFGESTRSTAGMELLTDLRRAALTSPNVPARQVSPGQRVRFTAAELKVRFAPAGEVGLFDGKSVDGVVDLLFYGPVPGRRYVRDAQAPHPWKVE